MLYNVTLRDLSIAGTVIGICLRLHECRETTISSPMRRRIHSSPTWRLQKLSASKSLPQVPFQRS